MKTKSILCLALLSFVTQAIQAQQAIASSGGNAAGFNGSSTYSIGQITYLSKTGSNGSVNEGMQQPYEIITLGTDAFPEITSLMVYPNPTTAFVVLKTGNLNLGALVYRLFDLNGREIVSQKISKSETQIHLEDLNASIYFLQILDNGKLIKTYKIIKNN